MNTDCLVVFKKKADRNLKNYLMAASAIDSIGEELYPEIIGVVNSKVKCYYGYDDAVCQYDKRYEAFVKNNFPDYNAGNPRAACILDKGDMMLLVAGKDFFMNNNLFEDTVLEGKAMVVFPAAKGGEWYDYKNVFVVNEDKNWYDCRVCCKNCSNPEKDKLPLNPLLPHITD